MGRVEYAHKRAVYREAQQEIESQLIIAALIENKIKCMPLKGMVIKHIYPIPNMRTMTDIDILVDNQKLSRINELMISFGYRLDHSGVNDEVYAKPPFMTVEFHRALIEEKTDIDLFGYLGSWDRAKQKDDNPYVYELSKEDFYVYMLGHAAKHFYGKGFGIRPVIDLKVYLDHYKEQLNWDYINSELKKCGLNKFAKRFVELSEIWFLNAESTEIHDKLTDYLINKSISAEQYQTHNIAKYANNQSFFTARVKRILNIIFPDIEQMKILYPWLEEKGYLIPICWLHRIIGVIFNPRRRKRLNILSSAISVKQSNVEYLNSIYKELGLSVSQKSDSA